MNGSGANVAGCLNCEGNCCRSYKVPVTVGDLRRLANGTELHPREFITLREGENSDFRLRPNGPAYDLYLTRRASSGGCVFLMEISETKARCGVYGHRPLVCSNFPMAMTQGMVELRQDTVCGPDSWNLATMDLSRYRRDILANKAAWGEHLELARAWNKAVDQTQRTMKEDDLFEFLLTTFPKGEEKREGQPDPATAASS